MTTVTTHERSRGTLLEGQRRVLERIASGAPLEETLELLVALIEEQAGDLRCAVLLADSGQQLRFVAAPNMGSCGTAAFLRQPVYTRDTATDPLWEDCGEIAVRNGLRAIWSTPILSNARVVLGTFAMYYGEPRLPSEEHIQLIDMATQVARIAIEEKQDELLRALVESSPDGILITDSAGTVLRVNQAFARMLGYTPAELHGRNVAEITQGEAQKLLAPGEEETPRGKHYRSKSGALLLARERWTLWRDAAGEPRYLLTRVRKMTDAGSDPLERLTRREREVLELVIAGRTSKAIGARLGIAATSVDTYRSRMMQKLSIKDLPGLVRFAIRHGIASV